MNHGPAETCIFMPTAHSLSLSSLPIPETCIFPLPLTSARRSRVWRFNRSWYSDSPILFSIRLRGFRWNIRFSDPTIKMLKKKEREREKKEERKNLEQESRVSNHPKERRRLLTTLIPTSCCRRRPVFMQRGYMGYIARRAPPFPSRHFLRAIAAQL